MNGLIRFCVVGLSLVVFFYHLLLFTLKEETKFRVLYRINRNSNILLAWWFLFFYFLIVQTTPSDFNLLSLLNYSEERARFLFRFFFFFFFMSIFVVKRFSRVCILLFSGCKRPPSSSMAVLVYRTLFCILFEFI